MNIKSTIYGYVQDSEILLYSISNSKGEFIEILNFGGIIHAWNCLDSHSNLADVLLGCENLEEYVARHPYFGCIVGRCGNRIANGEFILDGVEYLLAKNLSLQHHLHGGNIGFDRKIYDVKIIENGDKISLVLSSFSPHLEEGYPGRLDFSVSYTYHESNQLDIEYHAKSDQNTHFNPTNHCYFNLSGHTCPNILNHKVRILAHSITDTNDDLIPNGLFLNIIGTNLDFTEYETIGKRIFVDDHNLTKAKGYDHNFVIISHIENTEVASVVDDQSGRRLTVYTTEPGIQLYTGNWLYGTGGKHGTYQDYAGLCLETQHFPDTPNHPHFPTTILKRGETFYSKTVYKMDCI